MSEMLMLGIDCGGTHTDAALLEVAGDEARLLASAKAETRHGDLPHSIKAVAEEVSRMAGKGKMGEVGRITLGTTLAINAILQGKAAKVALALSAGPGLDPRHFALGDHVCIVPGGMDHRGVEVDALYVGGLTEVAAKWTAQGVEAVAVAGKFSPRNPAHENGMAKAIRKVCALPVTLGHELSGKLNFPRRIATAYYNAAVSAIQGQFLDAVSQALKSLGIDGALRLLKADGGATTFAQARREPVQSILSGPAASVMGAMAAWPGAADGCSLLLDMGGTTTDIAMLLNGSPIIARNGMTIFGRRTLVRSLATVSIAVGGDSLLALEHDGENGLRVRVGPQRDGPAMAFGGQRATLLDAFNVLGPGTSGDAAASRAGLEILARDYGMVADKAGFVAREAVHTAMSAIAKAAYELVDDVNSAPIYTLAALKGAREARPSRACLVGGPAAIVRAAVSEALGVAVELAPHPDVANAIGAALTRPTASLEVYADTGKGELWVPALNLREKISGNANPGTIEKRAEELLRADLLANGIDDAHVQVVESDLFATLDDYGNGSRDMRVSCQAVPGIMASLRL